MVCGSGVPAGPGGAPESIHAAVKFRTRPPGRRPPGASLHAQGGSAPVASAPEVQAVQRSVPRAVLRWKREKLGRPR